MSTDGGSAFPSPAYAKLGMTLRDYFAAKAMQGYCSCRTWREDVNIHETASIAYDVADAMIRARDAEE
ncbi:MAG TPA: hypothetical protein PKV98_13520 [Burkholderiaceae bacterium]|nr:hypothetical protein [Burkholderiaceae bacterium]